MKRKLLDCLAAIALSATLGAATPAMAFGGGFHGGGMGGFHGGGMGGFHGGGMGGFHGGMPGGGMRFGGGFHGVAPGNRVFINNGMVAGRGVFAPGTNRFVGGRFAVAPNRFAFAHNRFAFAHNRFAFARHRFFFRHRRFNNVAFFGVGFGGGYYYGDYCWRQVWTSYGWQWVNVCYY